MKKENSITIIISIFALIISIYSYINTIENQNYNQYTEASNVVPSFSSSNINSLGEPVLNFRLVESTKAVYPAPLNVQDWELYINDNLTWGCSELPEQKYCKESIDIQALNYASLEVEPDNPVSVSLVLSKNMTRKNESIMSNKEIVILIPVTLLDNGNNVIKLVMPYEDIMWGSKRTWVVFTVNYDKKSNRIKETSPSKLLIPELCEKKEFLVFNYQRDCWKSAKI